MQVTSWAAALGIGAAAWLALPRPRTVHALASPGRWSAGPPRPVAPALRTAMVLASVVGALLVLLEGTELALALIAAGGFAGAARLVVRSRARREALRRADGVVEICEALAGELGAGQPPVLALRRCVEVWPEIEPAATAAELGADVPRALRRLAARPGASGLAELAAAWQVSQTSGATMGVALGRVAGAARRRRATQLLVASELASAQATARLVALLPAGVLAMGSGLGGDPVAFLLTTPAGLACLASGLALALAGLSWIERISTSVVDP